MKTQESDVRGFLSRLVVLGKLYFWFASTLDRKMNVRKKICAFVVYFSVWGYIKCEKSPIQEKTVQNFGSENEQVGGRETEGKIFPYGKASRFIL